MLKYMYGLLCKRILQDKRTNSTSYIDIIDGMLLDDFPGQLTRFELATCWENNPVEEYSLHVSIGILEPGGDDATQLVTSSFKVDKEKYRVNIEIGNLTIQLPGRHTFVISFKFEDEEQWQVAGEIPFSVKAKKKEAVKEEGETD